MGNEILEEQLISDPATVPILFHEKKQEILRLLIQKEMNIIDLKSDTQMNPGTIKRHLMDLVDHNLIKQTRIEKNTYSITEKYYRATAKKYIVRLDWS